MPKYVVMIIDIFFAASHAPPPAPAHSGGGGSMLGGLGATIAQGELRSSSIGKSYFEDSCRYYRFKNVNIHE